VDYLARDFVSLRNALLDFASQRYPQWIEKIVADAGVMLAEVYPHQMGRRTGAAVRDVPAGHGGTRQYRVGDSR
jgi:hypothetical protein